jgi:4-alpha-glucanotransferase
VSTTRRTAEIRLALVTNPRQTAHNPEHLLADQPLEASEILCALERASRSPSRHEQTARAHLSLSGTLPETLSSPGFQQRVYGIVNCGVLLLHLQNAQTIEMVGTAYHHPLLPLIPELGRPEHVDRWLEPAAARVRRAQFPCFWPPELGVLQGADPHAAPAWLRVRDRRQRAPAPAQADALKDRRYRPHLAQLGGEQIVVRDATHPTRRSRGCRPTGSSPRSRPYPALRLPDPRQRGNRRRQRRMVAQHHTPGRLA